MQKHVNLVDLVKSFPTNIYLQNLASIQKRTSPIKFAHLAEKSEKVSVPNLSTKAEGQRRLRARLELYGDNPRLAAQLADTDEALAAASEEVDRSTEKLRSLISAVSMKRKREKSIQCIVQNFPLDLSARAFQILNFALWEQRQGRDTS